MAAIPIVKIALQRIPIFRTVLRGASPRESKSKKISVHDSQQPTTESRINNYKHFHFWSVLGRVDASIRNNNNR